ncbi:MAG: hypothetical protein ACK2TT_06220 [Anaerolineales bacterium]
MSAKRAFCIIGWHFQEEFFREVLSIPDADFYVLSHKARKAIPPYIIQELGEPQVLIRPNIGYDWGCYQQFLESGLWKGYEYLYFMHDDIEILDIDFPRVCEDLLRNHAVIGNGGGNGPASTTQVSRHPYAYAHSSWQPDSYEFQHKTVRGSFFATTAAVLERIGGFEVYWDPWRVNIDFGNWSTKASCGKLQAAFGQDCFGYLSPTFGRSAYLIELYRGDTGEAESTSPGWRDKLYQFLKRTSVVYMEILFRERELPLRRLWMIAIKLFLAVFSGRI